MRKKGVKINRANTACAYFPCHKGLQDCTFCYCPFYPCLNDKLGKYVFIRKTASRVWSCKDCSYIHRRIVVDSILKSIRKGRENPRKRSPGNASRKVGIIILGHGTRIKKANATIRRVIGQIKRKGGPWVMEPSYLQMHGPNLHASVKRVLKTGCRTIIVVPFFLFMGNHVKRDIPREIEREAKLYKDVKFIYARNLGDDPRICDIVLDCITREL